MLWFQHSFNLKRTPSTTEKGITKERQNKETREENNGVTSEKMKDKAIGN